MIPKLLRNKILGLHFTFEVTFSPISFFRLENSKRESHENPNVEMEVSGPVSVPQGRALGWGEFSPAPYDLSPHFILKNLIMLIIQVLKKVFSCSLSVF